MGNNYVVRNYIEELKTRKPVKAAEVESFLMRLNDMPGLSYRAVLAAPEDKDKAADGEVVLNLIPSEAENRGSVSFDNAGSRFLGPNEVVAAYQASILPLQTTSISGVASLPTDELKSGALVHSIAIYPNTTVELSGSYTDAAPGYNLKQFEIESRSGALGVAVNYQLIRQRDENLNLKLSFDGRNSESDILGTPLTRDKVRALRLGANMDFADSWLGYNTANMTLSKGLRLLDASEENNLNLSRSDATPDFTKLEISLSRLQALADNWTALVSASAQFSSAPLFSSEEFGYGGLAFGRAYDSSEITGDEGIAGAIEIRYNGFDISEIINLSPYIFYDIGKVWNESPFQDDISGSSAGFGLRFNTDINLSGNIGIAFPLTLPVTTPIYGYANPSNPRILFQISKSF